MNPSGVASSTRLRHFQDAFARALLATGPDGDRAELLAHLTAQPGFAVYRNTVIKGCIDALQANYPAITRLVGDEWFRAAAAVYVRTQPPRSPCLLDYGDGFAKFLAGFQPAAELPYLPAVAQLDRFWTEAHVARDETPVEAGAVAALRLEQLARTVLRPHASARWAWFEQPIFTIWQRNRSDVVQDSEVDWHAEGALVVRPYGAVVAHELDRAGCAFLDTCASGRTLAEAARAALAADSAADLTRLTAQLLAAGAFGSLEARPEIPQEQSE